MYACCLGLCDGVRGGSNGGAVSRSWGRARRRDGESRYGEAPCVRLGEVAEGLRGKDMILRVEGRLAAFQSCTQ